jgi:hypothetical protein
MIVARLALSLGFLALFACAGPAEYTVDDSALAGVPAGEQAGVQAAHVELDGALHEQAQADAELTRAEKEHQQARAEREQAARAADGALAAQRDAEHGSDIGRINQANREKLLLDTAAHAAEAKVDWLDRRIRAARTARTAAARHVECARARCQLEKARLVQAHGLAHSRDFSLSHFEAQHERALEGWQAARNEADARASEVLDAQASWLAEQKRQEEMRSGR